MIRPAHRHHEELAMLPQLIALGTPAALFAWHLIKHGLSTPATREPEEKNPVDTQQGA